MTSVETMATYMATKVGIETTTGDVGTYAMLGEQQNDRTARSTGEDVAASNGLYYAGLTIENSKVNFSSSPSGTWRLMGAYSSNSGKNDKPVSLWLRIS